ncbi:MAG: dTDP-4-dehydrorhamnose reductase [Bryobacterales bacterium]|nr:dTDP-4-dehydrorhamnose reductase [Bryobacterales bacterium]
MRTAILGAGGQLGVDLAREACKRGHIVLALTRRQLDVTDGPAVLRRLRSFRPDAVFNAAAYNHVDQAEREPWAAKNVNALGVRNVADACAGACSVLIHYSTDLVFSGKATAPYSESDQPCPSSVYGKSKLAGERVARDRCPSHYVLRVAALFGPAGRFTRRGNFAEMVLAKCRKGQSLRIVRDRFVSPTFGPSLAVRSLDILQAEIPYGLYHLAGGEAVSWYDFAVKVARASGAPSGAVEAIVADEHRTAAPRPPYSALSNRRIESLGIRPMPRLDIAVRRYLNLRHTEVREPLAALGL